mgnify:CR=1 FL=1
MKRIRSSNITNRKENADTFVFNPNNDLPDSVGTIGYYSFYQKENVLPFIFQIGVQKVVSVLLLIKANADLVRYSLS